MAVGVLVHRLYPVRLGRKTGRRPPFMWFPNRGTDSGTSPLQVGGPEGLLRGKVEAWDWPAGGWRADSLLPRMETQWRWGRGRWEAGEGKERHGPLWASS